MCPPAPVPPLDIDVYCTDEDLCMHLDKFTRGSPLPKNVFGDVNPYQYMPSYLPEAFWYFLRSEDRKGTEHGFWKARGDACEIFSNSAITGWRTTLEFHEGQAPSEQRTDWVMQEYKITRTGQYGNSKQKESGLLCRVFQVDGHCPNNEMPSVSKAVETSGQGSISESQVNKRDKIPTLAVAETLQNFPVENLYEENDLKDYLELDDLATPLSPFSSPDNLSCLSFSSDEYFNTVDLLKDLKDETNPHQQGNNANFQFSVCASVRPNEVVMPPATSGPLINGGHGKSPTVETLKVEYSLPRSAIKGKFPEEGVQKSAIKSQNAERRSESTLKLHNGASSSSTHRKTPGKEKKGTVGSMKKLKRKYLCFMPF